MMGKKKKSVYVTQNCCMQTLLSTCKTIYVLQKCWYSAGWLIIFQILELMSSFYNACAKRNKIIVFTLPALSSYKFEYKLHNLIAYLCNRALNETKRNSLLRQNLNSGNSPSGQIRKQAALLTATFTEPYFSQLLYKLCIFKFP